MPHYSKHNDAVRYDNRMKYATFTQEKFNDICDQLKQRSGYRMIVFDSFGTVWNKDDAVVEKITLPEGWEDW